MEGQRPSTQRDVISMFMGGNGQWVRARNEAGAKLFLKEKQLEAERHAASRARSRAFWKRLRRRGRSMLKGFRDWRQQRG